MVYGTQHTLELPHDVTGVATADATPPSLAGANNVQVVLFKRQTNGTIVLIASGFSTNASRTTSDARYGLVIAAPCVPVRFAAAVMVPLSSGHCSCAVVFTATDAAP